MIALLAQIKNPILKNGLGNPSATGGTEISDLLSTLITAGLVVGVLTFFVYFIYGAIRMIVSQGDKTHYQDAKNQLTQAATGLVLLLSIFLILNIIDLIFGLNLTKLEIPLPSIPSSLPGPSLRGGSVYY